MAEQERLQRKKEVGLFKYTPEAHVLWAVVMTHDQMEYAATHYICKKSGLHPSTVGAAVKKLVKEGWLTEHDVNWYEKSRKGYKLTKKAIDMMNALKNVEKCLGDIYEGKYKSKRPARRLRGDDSPERHREVKGDRQEKEQGRDIHDSDNEHKKRYALARANLENY